MSNPNPKAELEDWKFQNEDEFFQWVMDTKFKELEDWCAGYMGFNKDTYEKCLEAFIEEEQAELWQEYIELKL